MGKSQLFTFEFLICVAQLKKGLQRELCVVSLITDMEMFVKGKFSLWPNFLIMLDGGWEQE